MLHIHRSERADGLVRALSETLAEPPADPFTPDAAVYLLAACLAVLWWLDRPWLAMLLAVAGVFAKETVALVMTAVALAACVQPRARRRPWLIGALAAWVVVIGPGVAKRGVLFCVYVAPL